MMGLHLTLMITIVLFWGMILHHNIEAKFAHKLIVCIYTIDIYQNFQVNFPPLDQNQNALLLATIPTCYFLIYLADLG